MQWNDAELLDMWEKHHDAFPDSDWGMEGCGLSPDEAYDLMRRSIEDGHDYLEESFPNYPRGVEYGA